MKIDKRKRRQTIINEDSESINSAAIAFNAKKEYHS
jgi:hypothetical protein